MGPKEKKKYCPICKGHKKMKVTQYKKGKNSTKVQGQRRYDMKQRGFGGQTKPIFHKKAKTTKKTVLRNKCSKCGIVLLSVLKRSKSFELIGLHQRRKGSKKNII